MSKVTELMVHIGNESDLDAVKVKKADNALRGKHMQPKSSIQPTDKINADSILDKPVLNKITVEDIKQIYPVRVNNKVLERAVEIINGSTEDMDYILAKEFRDNCMSYIDIMKGGKGLNFEDYVNACKFATFKMAGNTDIRAYALTFPERIRRMERDGLPNSHLYQYANIYSRNKTVTEVMTKLMMPTHVLYQDIFHQAVKTQAEIMVNTKINPKIRSDAANSLMTHLKQPEIKKAELQINTKDSGVISDLANALANLSAGQREMMLNGKTTLKEINEAVIIEVEADGSEE